MAKPTEQTRWGRISVAARRLWRAAGHAVRTWRPPDGQKLATYVAAFAATGAVVVSGFQLYQMRLERRAWISIEQPRFTSEVKAGEIAYQFNFKNSGPSPGTITSLSRHLVIGRTDSELERDFPRLQPVPSYTSVIPPQASITQPNFGTLDEDQLRLILDGQLVLFVIGIIEYRDGLEHPLSEPIRTTRFCLVYSKLDPNLRFCSRFNSMD